MLKPIVGAAFAVALGLAAPVPGAASPLASPATTTVDLNLRAGPGTGYEEEDAHGASAAFEPEEARSRCSSAW